MKKAMGTTTDKVGATSGPKVCLDVYQEIGPFAFKNMPDTMKTGINNVCKEQVGNFKVENAWAKVDIKDLRSVLLEGTFDGEGDKNCVQFSASMGDTQFSYNSCSGLGNRTKCLQENSE